MEIWECLYDDYCNGSTFLSPRDSQVSKHGIEELVDELKPTPEQRERLQNLLFEFYFNVERRGFRAGIKLALRMHSE